MEETTRGTRVSTARDSEPQSYVGKRNATLADLEKATATYKGKPITIPTRKLLRWKCLDVRLDRANRLIFDVVRVSMQQSEAD